MLSPVDRIVLLEQEIHSLFSLIFTIYSPEMVVFAESSCLITEDAK